VVVLESVLQVGLEAEEGEKMKAYIEQIGLGHKEIKLPFGRALRETPDLLMISNGKTDAWVFSLFTGYRQVGGFEVFRPHPFKERMWVDVRLRNGKIVSVKLWRSKNDRCK